MCSELSIKRQLLKGLRKNAIPHSYCPNTGTVEISNFFIAIDAQYSYITGFLRNHCAVFGSFSIEFLCFDSFIKKLSDFIEIFRKKYPWVIPLKPTPSPKQPATAGKR